MIEISEHYTRAIEKTDTLMAHDVIGETRESSFTGEVLDTLVGLPGINSVVYGSDLSDDVDTHTLPFNIKLENTLKY